MKTIAICIALVSFTTANAQLLTLEPDNYPDGTILNNVMPGVSLITAGANNVPFTLFNVTTRVETFPYQPPTGSAVFAHVGIPFWNTDRRLRMDFNGVVSSISIDFMGSTPLAGEVGRMEVYGLGGELLQQYTTQPLFGGQVELMDIQRSQSDIAWAVAYTLPGQSVFGHLDHLVFSQPVAVPEPATVVLFSLAGIVMLLRLRRRG
jgi:hypothetical protein